jgi:hypothetical protein
MERASSALVNVAPMDEMGLQTLVTSFISPQLYHILAIFQEHMLRWSLDTSDWTGNILETCDRNTFAPLEAVISRGLRGEIYCFPPNY